MLWLGHWVGLIGKHLPNCSCLCSLCFIALLYFHHSVSMGYFVSSGILSLLLCGFLTSTCFKIPCRTLRKNVRDLVYDSWHQLYTSACLDCHPLRVFSAFSKLPNPCADVNQWFSTSGDFAPMGYLAESGDVLDYYNLGILLISTGWRPGMLSNVP